METVTIILFIIAFVLVLSGIAGLIFPVIPGTLLILGGLILVSWAENFAYVGSGTIIVLTLLTIFSYFADFIATALGAKKFGASRRASYGAAIGAIVGIFAGFIGVIIGPFIGAFIAEMTVNSDLRKSQNAGIGAWLGFIIGTVIKIALGFTMIGIYIIVRFI